MTHVNGNFRDAFLLRVCFWSMHRNRIQVGCGSFLSGAAGRLWFLVVAVCVDKEDVKKNMLLLIFWV